jgi:hypothetical protein
MAALLLAALSPAATIAPFDPPPIADAATSDPVLVGAGDIASCGGSGDSATAAIIRNISGTVFTAGDNAYPSGSSAQFAGCYDPSWGAFRLRTRPAAGNHDYETAAASAYFAYFGTLAGNPRYGFYAYNRGTWRIYVLNSNCWAVGGCAAGSPQERWLRNDLARYPRQCVLAYWHHPLFSSGPHGNNASVRPLWNDLYAAGAELVVNGHDHDYERFAPQSPSGVATSPGVREIVVGTGGDSHYSFATIRANSQVRNATTYGVLKLTLHAASYSWQFIPVAGSSFRDSGTTSCH